MNSPIFPQIPAWCNALTLTERIAYLRSRLHTSPIADKSTKLGKRRLQQWQSQPPSTKDSYFSHYLTLNGISEEDLLCLLNEPIEIVKDCFLVSPTWLVELEEAFTRPSSSTISPRLETLRGHKKGGFLDAIEPLINLGCDRLRKGVQAFTQKYSNLPFDPSTVEEIFLENVIEPLSNMLSRTLVLELNVARLQGLLQGETPQERFQSFVQALRQRDTSIALLQEYPVLARQLTVCIHNWVIFSLEFIQQLCVDWEIICTTYSPETDPGILIQVNGNRGDVHCNGRSVLIAKFSSGFQLVYKPKSLAVDKHFQELLVWLNHHTDHLSFRTLKILDRGSYGWVEFVAASECTSEEEIWRFYERQGGYLALLYALKAVDFHSENIIASGEHPILLDLEALFHCDIGEADLKQASQLAKSMIDDSVLSTGLLPYRMWSSEASDGIDVSGLGGAAGQLTPYGVPHWEGAGTDEMRLTRKRVAMPGEHNRPNLNGNEVDLLAYAEAITSGFTRIYWTLLKYRDELLSEGGPIERFAGDKVRVIVRGTRTYSSLIRDSFHPDFLRNALDRDRLFDSLWANSKSCPDLTKVIPSERDDLHKSDIPLFTTYPCSRNLWSSSGEQIPNVFKETPLTLVRQRLQHLSTNNLSQQLWFIRASLATLCKDGEQMHWSRYHFTEQDLITTDSKCLLSAARAVGDQLEALAVHGDQDIAWIGLKPTNKCSWSLTQLGMDFYDGLPGIALFLSYLGAITQEQRYLTLAQAVLSTMRNRIARNHIKLTGGFTGWGGIIYSLTHLGILWGRLELLTEAELIVDRLPMLIEQDEQFDIIGGAAGCISSLLSLYRCTLSNRTLAVAIQCGEHLLSKAQPMEHGIGWLPKFGGTKPLTGFSHGAAGIAWALLDLAAVTGEERFQKAALDAIAYERSLFRPEVSNWPDLRDFAATLQGNNNNQHTCMTAWCHGAPGIGLARLRCLQHLDDAEIRSEINAALKTTVAHGFGGNHSLCHGDLGNLELLLQASEILDEPQWRHEVNRLASIVLESINQHGWLCGIPLGVESPGLMTGLAGIGYGLLRLAEPTRVPSVLVLEPPVPNTMG